MVSANSPTTTKPPRCTVTTPLSVCGVARGTAKCMHAAGTNQLTSDGISSA
jgi:hypothetical protein